MTVPARSSRRASAAGRVVSLLLLCVGVLSACSKTAEVADAATEPSAAGASSTPSAEDSATPENSATSEDQVDPKDEAPGEGDGGISYDEALEQGVLTADYDAQVTASKPRRDSRVFTLDNVGQKTDRYRIRVVGPDGDEAPVSPDQARLGPGSKVDVTVDVSAVDDLTSWELVVLSLGRAEGDPTGNAEVVRVPLDWR